MTRWIRYFYEKQPHHIVVGACKAAAEYLVVAHKKPHVFGSWEGGRRKLSVQRKDTAQPPTQNPKKFAKKSSLCTTSRWNDNFQEQPSRGD